MVRSLFIKLEIMYVESKDYQELYDYIERGNIVCCTVDYGKFNIRDYCTCKKVDGNIMISVRGLQYGGVDKWYVTEFGKSERDLFIDECVRLKLIWFKP